jgi:hypothetical protein
VAVVAVMVAAEVFVTLFSSQTQEYEFGVVVSK